MAWKRIITDMKAGGGHTIDLLFNPDLLMVREVKSHPDVDEPREDDYYYDEFDPEIYGNAGVKFEDEVNKIMRRECPPGKRWNASERRCIPRKKPKR